MQIRSFYRWSRLTVPFDLLYAVPLAYGVLALAMIEAFGG